MWRRSIALAAFAAFAALAAMAAVAAGLQPAAVVAAQPQAWNFRVFLNDSPIGQHRFSLRRDGDEAELRSEARFEVKLLFITAYRYAHTAVERWRGNCLTGMTARTDDDGKKLSVDAAATFAASTPTAQEGSRLEVSTGTARQPLEGCVMSFAYWNPALLKQERLLNAQTGEHEAVRISDAGEERIVVRGVPVTARRYRIAGSKNPIDIWYSASREWLALESTLEGGRRLRYQIE